MMQKLIYEAPSEAVCILYACVTYRMQASSVGIMHVKQDTYSECALSRPANAAIIGCYVHIKEEVREDLVHEHDTECGAYLHELLAVLLN